MKIDANDPRWTAYALGELEDENERAALDAVLQESEEMRQLVEDIRRAAELLNDSLNQEPFAGLTESQRERIASQATHRRTWFRSGPVWALAGAAAALALGLSFWMYQIREEATNSASPMAQIADLREEAEADKTKVDETQKEMGTTSRVPEVTAPDQSVTVVGAVEEETVQTDEADIAEAVLPAEQERHKTAETRDEAGVSAGESAYMFAEKAGDADSEIVVPAAGEPQTANAIVQVVKKAGNRESEEVLPAMDAIRLVDMTGHVRDASGNGLAGVTVTATNTDNSVTATTVTGDDGRYAFSNLQPGKYTIVAELDGFQREIRPDLALNETGVNNLDFRLNPEVSPVPAAVAINGTVEDTAGSVLPGVTVTATNIDTNVETVVLTDNSGIYRFPALQPGRYKVAADLEGFQKTTKTDLALAVSSKNTLDFELNVAGMAEEVEVVTAAADIITESSPSAATVLESQEVIDLPLIDNDVLDLVNIMGGVTRPPEADTAQLEYERQTFAGVDSRAIQIQQDGLTINDVKYRTGVNEGTRIDPEKVEEFKLILDPVDAEYGRGAGQPMIMARSGREEEVSRRKDWRRRSAPQGKFNTEGYDRILDNPFMEVVQNPLSTFSIDVDTASYANVRRFLELNSMPPADAVRIEELVNYFDYDYKGPGREGPFAAHFEMTEAPWDTSHRLLRIGLKAKEIKQDKRPPTNLVFLIDVSGSMNSPNKLPLVKDSMHMLIDRMTETDRVAIVTYAGSTRVVLSSTRGDRKWEIHRAIDQLRSGGSTNGAGGIQLAYQTAQRNFIDKGANRVILATDGDFNVGITNKGDLTRLIEEKADGGVFLSALGYGMGNYKDDTLELLADKGRGNYAYIDSIKEAEKVLVEQINATLVAVAKDVKIQVEFNPSRVGAYRLIGYEDRIMPKEDFNNDRKKAGVIGAGHAVTALYEIVPPGEPIPAPGVDPLKYQKPVAKTEAASSDEVATVKIRYKDPEEEESRLMDFAVRDSGGKFDKASEDFKFAASVAAFGMVLRDSPYKGSANLEDALDWAREGKGKDSHGYRDEFIRLIHRAIVAGK